MLTRYSQRFNKTLKGGELITNDSGQDEFLVGEKLIKRKFELDLLTVDQKTAALNSMKKKGTHGTFIRNAYFRGVQILEEEAAEEERVARLAKLEKERRERMAQQSDGKATLEGSNDGEKEGGKRASSLDEGKEDTLDNSPLFKKAKTLVASAVGDKDVTLKGSASTKKAKKPVASVAKDKSNTPKFATPTKKVGPITAAQHAFVTQGEGVTLESPPVSENVGKEPGAPGVDGEGVTLQGEPSVLGEAGEHEFNRSMRDADLYASYGGPFDAENPFYIGYD